jgi:undecaprenyl-diphosphatase
VIDYTRAIILGLLQGVTELFPVSSLGHSVILPKLLGWDIDQKDPFFLDFLVATHLATALVLFGFFWRDWLRIIGGILRSLQLREIRDPDARLGWFLIVGTIPAGLLGLLLQDRIRDLFASAQIAAACLALNGVMLFLAERLRRRAKLSNQKESDADRRLAVELDYQKSVGIGAAQAIALVPGFSRTGAAMTGGLIVGLSHEDAARFSFLLATPIIGAAALLKLPDLRHDHAPVGPTVVGALCAGVTAYLSVRFLTRYFRTNTLIPFAVYCLIAGLLASVILPFR